MSSTTSKAHKINTKIKAYVPELRQLFYEVEKFKEHKSHIANEEFFRAIKSSKIKSLKMQRGGLMSCVISVGYHGYVNVKGEQTSPDSFYKYEGVSLDTWIKIRANILRGNSIGKQIGKHLANKVEQVNDKGELIKVFPFKFSKWNDKEQSWEVGEQWK